MPNSSTPYRHSSRLLQYQENSPSQAINVRVRTKQLRDTTRVETSAEDEKEDSAMQQAAEGGGKEAQDAEEEDAVGAVEETKCNDSRSLKRRASRKERIKSSMSWL